MPTTNCIWELQKAVYSELNGDATLATMITGIYSHVPQDTAFPYVVIGDVSSSDDSTKGATISRVNVSLTAYSRDRGNKEVMEIIAEIKRILNDNTPAVTGCSIISNEFSDSQVTEIRDGLTWRGNIDFIVVIQEGASNLLQHGDSVVLKIGDGATPTEGFSEIGGLKNTNFNFNNELRVSADLSGGQWQNLLGSTGIQSLSIGGDGYFSDSAAEETLRGYVFSASKNNYELHFGNGDKISGSFVVDNYSRSGRFNGVEAFSLLLQSAGGVVFTAA